jgi:hypothetical protein
MPFVVVGIAVMGANCSADEPAKRAQVPVNDLAVVAVPTPVSEPVAVPVAEPLVVVAEPVAEPNAAPVAVPKIEHPERPPVTVFDRIMIKPAPDFLKAPDALKALIEKSTGMKVASARRTAGTWVLVVFETVDHPRTVEDQAALIATLKKTEGILKAEGDRILKLK